jgi:CrcB protein
VTTPALIVGALLGTGLRLTIDAALPHAPGGWPWSTLVINLLGSFALGWITSRVWPIAPPWLRVGLGPGLLGTFTTFSALAVAALELTRSGLGLLALAYLALSVLGGLGAALLGLRLGAPRGEVGA